jgi:hypothetical protein
MRSELGTIAGDLQANEEFSFDEGRTWVHLRSLRYVHDDENMLDLWVQPSDDLRLASSFHIEMDEYTRVLLNRNWKG